MKHDAALKMITERISELERMVGNRKALIEDYETEIGTTKFQPRIDILQGRIHDMSLDVVNLTDTLTDLAESAAYLSLKKLEEAR